MALLKCNLTSVGHVAFVADEDLADASLRILFNFIDPSPHIVESLPVSNVVDDDDALGTYKQVEDHR